MVLKSWMQSAACTQRSGLTAVHAVGCQHMLRQLSRELAEPMCGDGQWSLIGAAHRLWTARPSRCAQALLRLLERRVVNEW